MNDCPGPPAARGRLLQASARPCSPPAPPPRPRSSGLGWEAPKIPAELGPGQSASQRPPPWLRVHYLIGKPFRKGAAEPLGAQGRGAVRGPCWQPPVPDEAGVTPPGVCLPSDRWDSSWLLSAFWGDQAALERAGGMALPTAGRLPGGQGIYFKCQNRIAGQEGKPGAGESQKPSPPPFWASVSPPSSSPPPLLPALPPPLRPQGAVDE